MIEPVPPALGVWSLYHWATRVAPQWGVFEQESNRIWVNFKKLLWGTQASGCLGCSPRREKARRIRGECAQASGCLNCSGRGRHKTQAQPNLRFCGGPENWNRPQCRAAPYRAAGSLSSVDGESTDTPVRGRPSVAGTRWVLPTHSDICLQRPALPVAGLNWTSEPK